MSTICEPVLRGVVETLSTRALLTLAKLGDEAATTALWNAYSLKLTRSLRRWFGKRPGSIADEEDLTVDVFEYLFRKLRSGAYQAVCSGAQFWKLAKRVATNKAMSMRRRERRLKRGGNFVQLSAAADMCETPAMPPEENDAAAEEELYRFLWLEYKRQPLFWPLVILRLKDLSVKQVAEALGLSCDAVYSKLHLMLAMLAEYANLSDAAKRVRVEHEMVRRRTWFNEAWAAHQRDLLAKAALR